MTRKCSHCNSYGHNLRTCPERGGRPLEDEDNVDMRKVQSMCNLNPTPSSRDPFYPSGGELEEEEEQEPPSGNDNTKEGYLSDSHVASGSNRERKKGVPWTEEEHRMFLLGLQKLGKGDWRGISRHYVQSRTPTQVASHAQKYFIRQSNLNKRKRRSSLFDIVTDSGVSGPGTSAASPADSPKAAPMLSSSPPFGSSPPAPGYTPFFPHPFAHPLATANNSGNSLPSENGPASTTGSAGSNSTMYTDKTATGEAAPGPEEVRSNPGASTAPPTYSGYHLPPGSEAQLAAIQAAAGFGGLPFNPFMLGLLSGFPALPGFAPPVKTPSKTSNIFRPTAKHATPGTWPISCPIPGNFKSGKEEEKPNAARQEDRERTMSDTSDREHTEDGGEGKAASEGPVGQGPGYGGYMGGHNESFRRVTPMCT